MPRAAAVVDETTEVPRTYTDWSVFDKAGIKVVGLECEGYAPYHLFNQGCHTRLIPNAASIKSHIDLDHGGGFRVKLAEGGDPSKESIWKQLAGLGLDLHDFTCEECLSKIKLSPATIKAHMRNHTNKNRRITRGEWFLMTFGYGAPPESATADNEL